MATEIRWRRGTTAQHTTFTGALAEVTVDTDKNTVVVHDGSTAGGFPLVKEADVGTGANQLVQLDATGRLPAVDGSQLTNISGGAAINVTNTPAGNISATDVQAAINELDTEKVKRIDLSNQVQTASYRKSVIALADLTNTDINAYSFSTGRLILNRFNGLVTPSIIEFSIQKIYNSTNAKGTIVEHEGAFGKLCTFTYNGVKYAGVEYFQNSARNDRVYFEGESNFGIFGLDYWDTQNNVATNTEVANSLAYDVTDVTDLHAGGIRVPTFNDVGTSANQLVQLDASARLPAVDGSQLTGITAGLGNGQTWQDVTASRANNTNYTNTTGRTIFIMILQNGGVGVNLDLNINGSLVIRNGGGNNTGRLWVSAPIPPGDTYRIDAVNAGIMLWWELR